MSETHAAYRLPRARIDPIDTPYRALAVLLAMIDPAGRAETIAILLDHERRGLSIIVVDATSDPDTLLGVLDSITLQIGRRDEVGGIVVASVRPHGRVELDDIDRWVEASELCEQSGIELVEWFVLGTGLGCPRELCGEPARWTA